MTRAERAAEAASLVALGSSSREVSESMGLSYSYVRELLCDPDGAKARARKASYRGACIDCGGPTDGSNGRQGRPERCIECRCEWQRTSPEWRIWDRESVIERMQEWSALYGQQPGARDWNPNMARNQGREDVATRFDIDGCWPHTSSVVHVFGTWNAAIEAAGFTPRAPGGRGPGQPLATPLALADVA